MARPRAAQGHDDQDHHLRALHRGRDRGHRPRAPAHSGSGCSISILETMIVTSADHRWYAIQTTAGHENKVRSLIQRRIGDDPRPDGDKPIRQALVPMQEVVEIKNGKKVTVDRKIYPGYVLVEMVLNQETIHVINGIQGVIKFVGTGR